MKPRCLHLLALACLILVERSGALAQEKSEAKGSTGVEAQLKDAMMENIKSTQAEDADATMKTIHSKSPVYQASKKQVSQIFGKHMGLKYELISLKHIATDGDYAIARVRQRTTQTPPKKHQEQRDGHAGRFPQGRRRLEVLEPGDSRVQVPQSLIVT
jgi:hypothetical protein